LYYRINVIELPVPPLRERSEDILPIARSILHRLAGEFGEKLPELSAEAQELLQEYHFPGNVRELENILERAVALSDGVTIGPADLGLGTTTSMAEGLAPTESATSAGLTPAEAAGLPGALEQVEREAIQRALENCRYNKTRAAAQLGISFRALRYKLKKFGMA
jgi:two-component system response regulator PilR (NtrC family)